MGYTKSEIIVMAQETSKDISTFYKSNFINYRGITSDTHEYYTEVVAEWLLLNINVLDGIKPIPRESSYYTPSHDGFTEKIDSNRTEERIAMKMFRQGEIADFGRIIDYQTPLKNKRSDKAGKIDLLSFENKTLHILELKEPESTESMLRCVLEGYTYFKTANREKLLDSFNLPQDTSFKTNPLVALNGHQHKEMKEGRPKLSKLMEILDIVPLYYYTRNTNYYFTEG